MTDHAMNPLDDAMPGRTIRARWVIRGMLTLETAMHLGGSEGTERVDAPVLRDPRSGQPLLPGTTFAGAMRSALANRIQGYLAWSPSDETKSLRRKLPAEPAEVVLLFGGVRGKDDGSQSPLIVFDALGTLPRKPAIAAGKVQESVGVEIRDGVAISPATGTAEDRKKYDYEVLPAGTVFSVRVDLLVQDDTEEKELLESLAAALDAFSQGENGFGAKRSRGLGRVSATWSAKRFALVTREGWMQWLKTTHDDPIEMKPSGAPIRDVLEEATPPELRPISLIADRRRRIVINLDLGVVHDILVRSPSTEAGAPDVSHLTSGEVPILPGTSLAGVMRARALRIAGFVHDNEEDAKGWVDRLFGPRFEGKRPPPGFEPRVSRLRVTEARLTRGTPQRQSRVAIDRFTQGVVDGALFDEQTQIGGDAQVQLELRNPEQGEVGLVLLVIKDLLSGMLPVGGTSSVGRGVITGTATVTFHDPVLDAPRSVKLEPGKPPAGNGAAEIVREIRAFHDQPARARANRASTATKRGYVA